MGGALACCPKLKKLVLTDMGADDAAMASFFGALGSGAAPALERLSLSDNLIGDEGMRHLADALSRGAALEMLNLDFNKIGDEGIDTWPTLSQTARRPRWRSSTSTTFPRAMPPSKRCRTRSSSDPSALHSADYR